MQIVLGKIACNKELLFARREYGQATGNATTKKNCLWKHRVEATTLIWGGVQVVESQLVQIFQMQAYTCMHVLWMKSSSGGMQSRVTSNICVNRLWTAISDSGYIQCHSIIGTSYIAC